MIIIIIIIIIMIIIIMIIIIMIIFNEGAQGDIQGSHYNLYDPEIATEELMCSESSEIYFCCGNLSTMSINFFKETHICIKYCKMMNLPSPI